MKKYIYTLFGLLAGAIIFIGSSASAQVSGSLWKLGSNSLLPVNSTWSLTIPQLGGSGILCLHTNNAGLISTSTADCGSGSGGTISTSSPLTSGQPLYATGWNTLASVASSSFLTSINGLSTALAKGYFLVGNDAGVAQATSTIFISSTGNVGIGTTSPYSLLSISNNLNTAANTPFFTIASTTGGTSTSTLMTVLANGNVGIGTASPVVGLDVRVPGVTYGGSGNTLFVLKNTTNNDSNFIFDSPTNKQTTFIFKNNGTSEWAMLNDGSGTVTGNSNALVFYDTAARMTILQGGNVGIGTTNPEQLLEVKGGSPIIMVHSSGASQYGTIQFTNSTPTNTWYIGQKDDNNFRIYDAIGGLEAVTIKSNSGNVGIGTTSPFSTLSVSTAAQQSGTLPLFTIASTTNRVLFSVLGTGHIMASSTSPTLSSCGTSPSMVGDDMHGTVTAGGTTNACTLTFANAYTIAPVCTVTSQTGSVVNTFSYAVTNTTIIITETSLGTGKWDYHCFGLTGN